MHRNASDRYPSVRNSDPAVFAILEREHRRQHQTLELIASENHVSPAVLEAAGSVFTNKYAEGYPGKRYYGGCQHVDEIESLAIERARQLFGADHANVQPHSGSQANQGVFLAALTPGDTILSLNLNHGGHLSHGMKVNISGKWFNVVQYGVSQKDERIDMDEVRRLAREVKPKLIITGASAYPRIWDWDGFARIAEEVDALLLADIAHIAGLVAAGLHPSPVSCCPFVTTTTHKTLRGPRSGLILCKGDWAKKIDSAIFPGLQGGPLVHIIAAKAIAFGEALRPEFRAYQRQILSNARALAEALIRRGYRLVSGGTDNHLMLVNLTNKKVTGKEAQLMLDDVMITVNKNGIPFDTLSPAVTSGIRIGTPAVTSRGMKEAEMAEIAEFIDLTLSGGFEANKAEIITKVEKLTSRFQLY